MENNTYQLSLKLRPAVADDFVHHTEAGEKTYLYGKFFAIRNTHGKWCLDIFRKAPASIRHFSECFKQGMVYVIADPHEAGVLDVEAEKKEVR